MKRIIKLAIGILLLVLVAPTFANENANASDREHFPVKEQQDSADKMYWEVDVAFLLTYRKIIIPDIVEREKKISAAINLSGGFYYKDFFVEAAPLSGRPFTIGYSLFSDESQQVNLITESLFFKLDEDSQESGNMLDGINERKSSMEVGVEYFSILKKNDIRLKLLHDGLNRHNGTIATFEISRPFFTKHFMLVPGIAVSYVDDNAADYYYGVSREEVRSFRPEYHAKGSVISTVRVYLERPLNDSWSIVASGKYSYFGEGIADSPLVQGREDNYSFNFGVLWTF
ncbi:MipA/OmpV family protein [Thalassotalea sp. M1531]|uniref:MipA/OmpV family protein n=1 Tax=Thalassotalea algicola TaxID=2716224 RepID=A0A7Y0Q7Z5_9GAMM|nr:MipA/OmpV family protein [Thalassotalea algicola]NMP32432.1 MipA/OmpV family protein [Thalassotalea algicola]